MNYDCIVPISGASDSYFIVHIVKNILGLNPLLVTYNKYYNTSIGIKNLSNLRIKFDCDLLILNVNPLSVKKLLEPHSEILEVFIGTVLQGRLFFQYKLQSIIKSL